MKKLVPAFVLKIFDNFEFNYHKEKNYSKPGYMDELF